MQLQLPLVALNKCYSFTFYAFTMKMMENALFRIHLLLSVYQQLRFFPLVEKSETTVKEMIYSVT